MELPNAQAVEKMLDVSRKAAIAMGMHPYYMYRQKYMQGNFENVGYTKPGLESIYNIDNMEETASVLALGAGAITKWVYDGGRRIERVADPQRPADLFRKDRHAAGTTKGAAGARCREPAGLCLRQMLALSKILQYNG